MKVAHWTTTTYWHTTTGPPQTGAGWSGPQLSFTYTFTPPSTFVVVLFKPGNLLSRNRFIRLNLSLLSNCQTSLTEHLLKLLFGSVMSTEITSITYQLHSRSACCDHNPVHASSETIWLWYVNWDHFNNISAV